MTFIIICIIIYVISFLLSWKWMNIANNNKGRYYLIPLNFSDILVTIVPGINSIFLILWIIFPPYANKNKNKISFVKRFFKVNT